MIIASLLAGLTIARRHLRLAIALFALNLLTALALTVPFYRELMGEIGYSLTGTELLEGFRFSWLAEFEFNHPSFFPAMDSLILPVAIIYFFVQSVLAGGIIEALRAGEGDHPFRRFSQGVSQHFFPFLRLALISFALYLLTYRLVGIRAGKWLENLAVDSPSQPLAFAVGVGGSLLTLAALLFLDMVFDYARIKKIIDGFPSALLATLGALRFCLENLRGTACLYLLLLLLAGGWIGLYLLLYSIIPQNQLSGIVYLFLVQEIFMLGRVFLGVAAYSCQMEYYLRSRYP